MKKRDCVLQGLALSSLLLAATPTAPGQQVISGGTAFDNLSSAAGRAPGNLVNAGVARAMEAADRGRAQPNITETVDTSAGPQARFLADAVAVFFREFNELLAFFGNQLAVRSGLSPIFETNDASAATGSTSSGDSTPDDSVQEPDDSSTGTDRDAGGGRTGRRKTGIR